jgi:uridine kinase
VNQHLNQIRAALPELFPRFGDCVVITIDGPAGSGKTTLALTLEREIDSSYTIHMDELYEGWGSTMTPTLTSKLITILESVAKDESVLFTPFNWLGNCPGTPISVKAPKYLIIEGVGAGQSSIRKFVSLAIWIEVPEDEGLARVLERDGPEVAEFMPSFIEAQAAHFSKEDTKKSADYHLSGHHIV